MKFRILHVANVVFFHLFTCAPLSMGSSKRRMTAEPNTHRSSKAKVRLLNQRSKVSTESSSHVVANGIHSESGFRDVRTHNEKNRLLLWVKPDDDIINQLGRCISCKWQDAPI